MLFDQVEPHAPMRLHQTQLSLTGCGHVCGTLQSCHGPRRRPQTHPVRGRGAHARCGGCGEPQMHQHQHQQPTGARTEAVALHHTNHGAGSGASPRLGGRAGRGTCRFGGTRGPR